MRVLWNKKKKNDKNDKNEQKLLPKPTSTKIKTKIHIIKSNLVIVTWRIEIWQLDLDKLSKLLFSKKKKPENERFEYQYL